MACSPALSASKHCASPSVAQRASSATAARGRRKRLSSRLGLPVSVSVLPRTHVRHRSFRAQSYPSIPRNGAGPGHEDGHLIISLLRPPPRKPALCFLGSRPTAVRLELAPRQPAVSPPPWRRSHLNTGRSTRPRTHHRPPKLLSSQRATPPSHQPTPSNPHRSLLPDLASSPAVSFSGDFRTPARSVWRGP
jgi:hypothetical protein